LDTGPYPIKGKCPAKDSNLALRPFHSRRFSY
jgi:hypothetical protein